MDYKFPLRHLIGSLDVLIVDDEPDICELIQMYLESLEIFRNIIIANDGHEAQIKLSNQNFALILLDINIPKKTGIELLRYLDKSKNEARRVIMITGELSQANLKNAMAKGVKNFIVKPFDEETFSKKILEVLLKAEGVA